MAPIIKWLPTLERLQRSALVWALHSLTVGGSFANVVPALKMTPTRKWLQLSNDSQRSNSSNAHPLCSRHSEPATRDKREKSLCSIPHPACLRVAQVLHPPTVACPWVFLVLTLPGLVLFLVQPLPRSVNCLIWNHPRETSVKNHSEPFPSQVGRA